MQKTNFVERKQWQNNKKRRIKTFLSLWQSQRSENSELTVFDLLLRPSKACKRRKYYVYMCVLRNVGSNKPPLCTLGAKRNAPLEVRHFDRVCGGVSRPVGRGKMSG